MASVFGIAVCVWKQPWCVVQCKHAWGKPPPFLSCNFQTNASKAAHPQCSNTSSMTGLKCCSLEHNYSAWTSPWSHSQGQYCFWGKPKTLSIASILAGIPPAKFCSTRSDGQCEKQGKTFWLAKTGMGASNEQISHSTNAMMIWKLEIDILARLIALLRKVQ